MYEIIINNLELRKKSVLKDVTIYGDYLLTREMICLW